MSSISSPPSGVTPGPLTTIFTPPSGCFSPVPTIFSLISSETASFWSLPNSCFPAGAGLELEIINNVFQITKKISYSPGVLPVGFHKAYDWSSPGTSYVIGCITSFDVGTSGSFCTSQSPLTKASGEDAVNATVIMPQFGIEWQTSDLSLFTPASAPAWDETKLSSWEASVTARTTPSSSKTPRGAETSASSTSGTSNTDSASSNEQNSGLSTGAQAGIGVGVAIGALLVAAIILLFLRRMKKRKQLESSEKRPYLDSKAELDDSGRRRTAPVAELSNREPKELATYERPQELSVEREPPPIPLASKPI